MAHAMGWRAHCFSWLLPVLSRARQDGAAVVTVNFSIYIIRLNTAMKMRALRHGQHFAALDGFGAAFAPFSTFFIHGASSYTPARYL